MSLVFDGVASESIDNLDFLSELVGEVGLLAVESDELKKKDIDTNVNNCIKDLTYL